MKKRFMAGLLALAMLAALLPLSALATEETVVAKIGTAEYTTLQDAVNAGGSITLLADVELSETITVAAGQTVTLDLAGHTITGTDQNTSGNFELIANKGTLTIRDSVGTGAITLTATTDRDWKAYSAVVANLGGTLTVNGGTIRHLGGTSMAYGIDNNSTLGDTVLTISGGSVLSNTYRAIRQFANSATHANTVTVNGGTVKGGSSALSNNAWSTAIWMQSPNADANKASLTIAAAAKVGSVNVYNDGDVSGFSLSVAADALIQDDPNGVASVLDNVSDAEYAIVSKNGSYTIEKVVVAKIGDTEYSTLTAAIEAASQGDTIEVIAEEIELPKITTAGLTFKTEVGTKITNEISSTNSDYGWRIEGTTFDGFEFTQKIGLVGKDLTVKNCTFSGKNGIYSGAASGTWTIENCTFNNQVYGLHVGDGTESTVTVKNSVITGWNSYASMIDVIFDNCTFKGNSGKAYSVLRTFGNLTIRNSVFEEDWVSSTTTCFDTIGTASVFEVSDTEFKSGDIFDYVGYKEGILVVDPVKNEDGKYTGGTFASEPTASVIADGYYASAENGRYVLKESGSTPAEVTSTTTNATVAPTAKEEVKEVAKDVTADATGLTGEANDIANNNTVTTETKTDVVNDNGEQLTVEQAVTELAQSNENMGNLTNEDEEKTTVEIAVVTYLDITVTDAQTSTTTDEDGSTETTTASITVEITPMAQTVATTQKVLADESQDIVYGEDAGNNAVAIGKPVEIENVTTPVTITLGIPASMATLKEDSTTEYKPIYVKHIKSTGVEYVYEGKVAQSGTEGNYTYTLTFVNPHGFSEFVLLASNPTVATLNGTNYASLQAAVNAVADGETITLVESSNETITVSKAISFTIENHNQFVGTISAGGSYKKEMTAGDEVATIVTYTFTYQPAIVIPSGPSTPASYSVTIAQTANGTVSADVETAAEGDTVTLTVAAADGFELAALTVTDAEGNEIALTGNTFQMPASNVTVTAAFQEVPKAPAFTDVPEEEFYHDAVYWAVEQGITKGTSDTTFDPLKDCTRAQAVTFLWRAAGSPEPESTGNPFTDVDENDYYSAILWAVEQGITKGTSETTFGPEETVTRSQVVTFLWRMMEEPAVTGGDDFTDVTAEDYFAAAVQWAVEQGITQGVGDNLFAPGRDCDRSQIVTFLYRHFVK